MRNLAVLIVIISVNNAFFYSNDVSTWLNYDVSCLECGNVQSIIEKASKDLQDTGAFIVPQILKPHVKDLIAMELNTVKHIPRTTTRTVFQDKGDFVNFDKTSPRNFMLDNSMEFVSRVDIENHMAQHEISSHIISLYNYDPLLEFWRKITNSTDIYLSKDEAGSVYGFYGRPNDWFSWHFDESPFTCIYMIQKPVSGGYFRYILMDNPIKTPDSDQYDKWNELGIVLHNEQAIQDRIFDIDVNEGDVYCMFGNQTLHEVTKINGDTDRSVFIMTYGNTRNFEHTHNVHDLNQWNVDTEKQEL